MTLSLHVLTITFINLIAALSFRKYFYCKQTIYKCFYLSFQVGRPWLIYDADKETMTCQLCITYGDPKSKNTFTTGSSNLRVSAVKEHEASKCHLRALNMHKAQSEKAEESVAGWALLGLKQADRDWLSILFCNAHAVGKHNLSLTHYTLLAELDRAKGLNTGQTFLNDKAALRFMKVIATTCRDKVIGKITKAPYFSFMMDGSTDIGGNEEESIFIWTCEKGNV